MKSHPYQKYENLPEWSVVNRALDDLIENNDIKETTARQYIVGYLLKSLDKKGLLAQTPKKQFKKK